MITMKSKIFIVILLLFIITVISIPIVLKSSLTNDVRDYLTSRQGYLAEDIKSIKSSIGKAPVLSTKVIFEDEPTAKYFYKKEENGVIIQFSCAPIHGVDNGHFEYKHREVR